MKGLLHAFVSVACATAVGSTWMSNYQHLRVRELALIPGANTLVRFHNHAWIPGRGTRDHFQYRPDADFRPQVREIPESGIRYFDRFVVNKGGWMVRDKGQDEIHVFAYQMFARFRELLTTYNSETIFLSEIGRSTLPLTVPIQRLLGARNIGDALRPAVHRCAYGRSLQSRPD